MKNILKKIHKAISSHLIGNCANSKLSSVSVKDIKKCPHFTSGRILPCATLIAIKEQVCNPSCPQLYILRITVFFTKRKKCA